MTQFRSRKKNGKTIRYPLSRGMSEKAADHVAAHLRADFPDESVRVLSLDKRKKGDPRKRYAPYISYLFESIKSWRPLEQKYHVDNYIPRITGNVLRGLISPKDKYYVFLDPSDEDIVIFGRDKSSDLTYIIEWPGQYYSDGDEAIVMMDGSEEKTLDKEFQLDAMKTRIRDEMQNIAREQETSAIITDFEADQINSMVGKFPPNTTFEVHKADDTLSVFPIDAGGDSLSFHIDGGDADAHNIRSFFTGTALSELLHAFQQSGSPNMTIALNEKKDTPLFAQFYLYDKLGYHYGGTADNGIKSSGVFNAVILPASTDPDAVRLPYF